MTNVIDKKILLIEDELSQREPLAQMLKGKGFTVLEARNGEEGLKIANDQHPDLIILDMIMPEMDGVGFMKTLRKDTWGMTVPLIMLTNVSPDADNTINTIDQYHLSYYLNKGDISLNAIADKVNNVLQI